MTRNTESLPQLATQIRALERKIVASTIEIGRLLQVAFDRFEHGDRAEYHGWVETEFAWSERTARRYRELYEFQIGHSVQFDKLNITLTALYALAELSKDDGSGCHGPKGIISEEMLPAIEEVIQRAKTERVTRKRAEEIISENFDRLIAKGEAEATPADEPEPEPDVEPELDAVEPEVDADEPEPETDELPPHNELSDALMVLAEHGMFSPLWVPTVKLIDQVTLLSIIKTLNVIAFKQSGDERKVDDALKSKADRAEARSRAKCATILQFPAEREDA